MSDNSNNDLEKLYQKKDFSLVSRAFQEFNKNNISKNSFKTNTQEKIEETKDSSLGEGMEEITRKGANPPKKRSVLGRGLSALMSPTTTIDIKSIAEQNSLGTQVAITQDNETQTQKIKNDNIPFQNIPIDKLSPNPNQPRTTFDQKEIRELATSIRKSGVLQPLLVRKKANTSSAFTSYEIVAGERRWRAAKEAGLITVPAIIKEFDDREALEIGIIENIQRQDLNPIEEAVAYSRLVTEFSATQEQLSQVFGKDRSSISNTLRLLNLPNEIQELLKQRKLSSGHGRTLLGIENKEEQLRLANILAEEKLFVREAEKLANDLKPKSNNKKQKSILVESTSPSDLALEDRLRRALGTKVKVQMTASGKGEVKISFFSRAEFENFMEKVGA